MKLGFLLISSLFILTSHADDVGYFWHVTDFHYDQTYWTDGLSCNDKVPVKGKYGDYWCDSPWSLVMESIKEMAKVKADVDFLIWTGDTVAHIKNKDTSQALNLDVAKNVTDALTGHFPNINVYASLGNHDFFPSDDAPAEMSEFYKQIWKMWEHWIDDKQESELFKRGGYYSKQVTPKIKLLALNTNLYYKSNDLTENMTDPAGQLEWLRQELNDARQVKHKVFLTGHVPVGPISPGLATWFHPQYEKPFLDLILEYDDVITASHFGHNHGDGFQILQNNNQKAIPQFIAPSVTPWRYKIPGKTGAAHNPGVRLVKYDKVTGENLDYDQYYMNLTLSNEGNSTKWDKLYTFTEAYGVPDMSVESLRIIFEDKMKPSDSKEGQQFCNYHLVSAYNKPCTLEMRADIRCAGLNPLLEDARTCANDYIRVNSGSGKLNFTMLSFSAVILAFMSW